MTNRAKKHLSDCAMSPMGRFIRRSSTYLNPSYAGAVLKPYGRSQTALIGLL
jgi:hypothetical protein